MLDVERGAFLDLWPRFVPVGALLVGVRDLKDAASSSALLTGGRFVVATRLRFSAEDGFQWKGRIEMIRSQPVVVKKL